MTAAAPSPPLDYLPGAAIRRRRRRRTVVGAVAALALVVLGAWLGPGVWRRSLVAYRERGARNYVAPPDRVVYEEDPGQWAALLARPNYRRFNSGSTGWNSFVAHTVPEVGRLAQAGELRLGGTAVFCHARQSPAGNKRLVVVWLASNGVRCTAQGASPDNQVQITFCTSVVDGGTMVREGRAAIWVAPQSVAENRQTPLYARLFGGQADPTDPSHFTIAFDLDLYTDVIDGYLRDDNRVVLRPRSHEHMLNPK
jgi:hypothetical protein